MTWASLWGELQEKLILWKTRVEGKWLQVNMGKTNVQVSGPRFDKLEESGRDHCAVCPKYVDKNSILCGGCSSWVHKRWSGVSGIFKPNTSLRCKRCMYWTGQTSRCQANDRNHSGKGEAWGCVILMLPWGLLIIWCRLWTHFHHRMSCPMG